MSAPLRIVVVGGVAAGPKAAARARRLDPNAEITIVEKDKILSYAGCGLPYYISGMVEGREDLMSTPLGVPRDATFFSKIKNIRVLNETLVESIDREVKEITVRRLAGDETEKLPYDKLILATGAEPVEPPIRGKDLDGVLRLKRMEDADRFRGAVTSGACSQVVIIGAGLIGMEMTEALTTCGSAVTIVEMLPQVLPAVLDADMAALLEKHMRSVGIRVLTGTRVQSIEGDGQVRTVVTDRGPIPAQLVLLSVGIRPNVELAKQAGLLIGPSGGIHVNEYMQTSDRDIYAAGDCAEKSCYLRGTDCVLALGSIANKEGRVAGSNAAGFTERFPGVVGATALKIFDWNVGRAGLTMQQAEELGIHAEGVTVAGPDKPHYYPGSMPVILKLIADRKTRHLIGVQGVGPGDVMKRIDVAITALTAHMSLDEIANLDLAYAPPYSEAIDVLLHAANALRNKLDGHLDGMNALELHEDLLANKEFTLLDVRTPEEHETAHIQGDTLIPLGALRGRMAEIPKEKEVVVYCRTSLRAWEAYRMLVGEGYKARLLDGGIIAWPFE